MTARPSPCPAAAFLLSIDLQPPAAHPPRHAVRLGDDGFIVSHRGLDWPGFSYRWADDLRGLEFWHDGEKVGEVCTPGQVHADLSGRGLPDRVIEVATITFGVLV